MRVGKSTLPLTAKTKKQIMELVKQYGTGEPFCSKRASKKYSHNCNFTGNDDIIFLRFS